MVTERGFIKFHLAITRDIHEWNKSNGVYPKLDPDTDPVLKIREEDVPTFEDLKYLLERVGGPYQWDLRREFFDRSSVRAIKAKLAEPTARRFSFLAGDKVVGGTVIANIQSNIADIFKVSRDLEPSRGIEKISLPPEAADRTIEIFKIGLFPQYTNRGWGRHFFPQLLDQLFNGKARSVVKPPEVVYLNTRDTNHNGVLGFYRKQNMHVIHAHDCPNDIIDPSGYESPAPVPRRRGNDVSPPIGATPAPVAA